MKKLYAYVKFCSLGNLHTASGIAPDNRLCATFSCSRLVSPPISSGNGPGISLKLTSSTVRFFSRPISLGKHDRSPLFKKITSFSLVMLPRLAGTQPRNLLLATTTTDTGEFPKLLGISKTNRLSLTKRASSSMSKSCAGTPPSNSLNLRSRYLRDGSFSTTLGNFPAKRLLLTSSS